MISSKDLFILKTKLDLLTKQAQELKDRHYSVFALGGKWDNQGYFEQFKQLKAKIKLLEAQILQ